MLDLKPYLDAVTTAKAEWMRIASEIDALYSEGSDESKAKALDLRPSLDEAEKRHAEAKSFYEAMQRANQPNDVAKNFVPISKTPPDQAEGHQPTVIKRQEYDRMTLVERAEFIKSGGTLED